MTNRVKKIAKQYGYQPGKHYIVIFSNGFQGFINDIFKKTYIMFFDNIDQHMFDFLDNENIKYSLYDSFRHKDQPYMMNILRVRDKDLDKVIDIIENKLVATMFLTQHNSDYDKFCDENIKLMLLQ